MSNNKSRRFEAYDYLVCFIVVVVTVPAIISAARGHISVLDIAVFCAAALLIGYYIRRLLTGRNRSK